MLHVVVNGTQYLSAMFLIIHTIIMHNYDYDCAELAFWGINTLIPKA